MNASTGFDAVHRRLEVGDIVLHRLAVAEPHVTDAAQPAEHLRSGELDHAIAELRIVRQVALRLRRERFAAEAGEAVLDVGGVADLAGLAVADDVDADGDLVGDDLGDRPGDLAIEFGMIVRLLLVLLHQQIDQRLRPRQAADVGRQDAVRAELHGLPPGACCAMVQASRGGAASLGHAMQRPIERLRCIDLGDAAALDQQESRADRLARTRGRARR